VAIGVPSFSEPAVHAPRRDRPADAGFYDLQKRAQAANDEMPA
jgi:hypothetical protein